jgi:signal transduction histidine kinase/DNA-binding response OmpR family regulator
MTSHELRNPLSAVVQCAESAMASLEQLRLPCHTSSPTEDGMADADGEINSAIDALQTIITCSLHQKRVIDDVLTLSKLDSDLIVITPVKVQPVVVILEAMKMFDVECKQSGIKLEFVEDSTAKHFEWVMLDPSRLLQVLINLLTNAIKFTKGKPESKITVEFGGSWIRPPAVWEAFSLRTDGQLRTNILDEPGWGCGTKAYLWIKVKDTGCGMTEDEQKKLFSRFTQATPRTHVKYGGSGLGLFISKTLATLQGGAIGVSSEKGEGSTFMFFISTRITDSPEKQIAGHGKQVRPVPFERALSSEAAMKAVKLSILIVEDNIVNQKVLKKQLEKCGWTIHVAGNGEDALRWLKESVYWRGERDKKQGEDPGKNKHDQERPGVDVILLDIFMPVMDGLTCVRRIRDWEEQGLLALPPVPPKTQRSPSTPSLTPITANYGPKADGSKLPFQIPILAVSANARMEQIQEALRAGMNDAITKPFRIPELWPKILSLVPRLSDMKKERQT